MAMAKVKRAEPVVMIPFELSEKTLSFHWGLSE